MSLSLYSYWRSSAAYRVRIALNLKGLEYATRPVSLLPGESEHREAPYRDLNPQMLLPYLVDGDTGIAQSLAILEYLEETRPDPALLPAGPAERSAVRSFCSLICCDIHPLNNLRVLAYLEQELGADSGQRITWYRHWVTEGFRAAERLAADAHGGPYVFGAKPTLADACLVPQMYNARRFEAPLDDFPTLVAIDRHCNEQPEFIAAQPERQPDAPG